MNGDTADTLFQQNIAVMEAARALLTALSKAAPHGRNYQTLDDDASFEIDRAEHCKRVACVQQVLNSAEADAILAMNQKYSKITG